LTRTNGGRLRTGVRIEIVELRRLVLEVVLHCGGTLRRIVASTL
jgi:hypothetical protein